MTDDRKPVENVVLQKAFAATDSVALQKTFEWGGIAALVALREAFIDIASLTSLTTGDSFTIGDILFYIDSAIDSERETNPPIELLTYLQTGQQERALEYLRDGMLSIEQLYATSTLLDEASDMASAVLKERVVAARRACRKPRG